MVSMDESKEMSLLNSSLMMMMMTTTTMMMMMMMMTPLAFQWKNPHPQQQYENWKTAVHSHQTTR
jgi:hypothetical protein